MWPTVYCVQCKLCGDHKALETGLAGCSAPGTCMYCGMSTSRSLYKQHELECEKKEEGPNCLICKRDSKDFKHSPANPAYCEYTRKMLRSFILARESRQRDYNHRMIAEMSRRILMKGGNPGEIFEARSNIWKGVNQTNIYLALMAQFEGMEKLSSTWDVNTDGKEGEILFKRTIPSICHKILKRKPYNKNCKIKKELMKNTFLKNTKSKNDTYCKIYYIIKGRELPCSELQSMIQEENQHTEVHQEADQEDKDSEQEEEDIIGTENKNQPQYNHNPIFVFFRKNEKASKLKTASKKNTEDKNCIKKIYNNKGI